MNSKATIVLGLASATGVFAGLFAGYAVIKLIPVENLT